MPKNSFNYPHTCPQIDKNIDSFKQSLSDMLDELISEINPLFSETSAITDFRNGWEKAIFDAAEKIFEDTRKANEDMRKEAEYQIDNLTEELEEARDNIKDLERKVSDLEDEVVELNNQLK